jgi:hypothetical protein
MAEKHQGRISVAVGCDILATDLRPVELRCGFLKQHFDRIVQVERQKRENNYQKEAIERRTANVKVNLSVSARQSYVSVRL